MGIRIHKAVGYGMPIDDFYQSIKLPIERKWNLSDELDEYLPDTANMRSSQDSTITGHMGLADLFAVVGDGDKSEHIIMFPTYPDKVQHFRYDDPIDYYLAVANDHTGNYSGKVTYMTFPLPPREDFMDRNGVRVDKPQSGNDPAVIPGIPDIMREWLTRYGIFDLSGIAKIRPMAAEWWS